MKKVIVFILLSIFMFLSVFNVVKAQAVLNGTNQQDDVTHYTLLEPLSSDLTTFDTNKSCPLGSYLGTMINVILGIIAVAAMVMIVMGGIEYMTSELGSSKQAGKEKITNAIFGLLIALSAWLILNTINPKLLDVCLKGSATGQINVTNP